MSYIENIYICLAAPLLVAVLCTKKTFRTMMLFLLGGMTACILSSYISTFLAVTLGADMSEASMTIAPLVEEIMKILPVLFYLHVFGPGNREVTDSIIMMAIGFATFENVCYIANNGTAQLLHLLIRGFGTGAMHVVCGLIIVYGVLYLWDKVWLRVAGIIGLLAAAITYHGIYNILVSQTGAVAMVGYLVPTFTAVIIDIVRRSNERKR